MNHLSSIDASFLHFETPETPMHVGSLMLFDLPEGYSGDYYEDVKAVFAKRLHMVSLFHRKLAPMPFDLANPVWIEDDDIDLDYHVRSITLRRPGTMEQLERHIARLHSSLLDRSRPLWEVYVIEGLQSGQIAYYTKAHHSGIDGKAGVELSKVLYDPSPEIREVPPPRRSRAAPSYQLGVAELLQAAISNAVKQYLKTARLVPTAVRALVTARKIIAGRTKAKGQRSLNLGLAPRTIFNASITNQRSFTTLSVPLANVKALGKRVGGTVNSIVMAMCATALRRFLLERSLLPAKSLIAAVPVSLRSADDDSANNQVSMIRVDLATDIADPLARFKAIHASSEDAKAVVSELKPVLGADLPVLGSPWIMSGLASLYGRSGLADRIPQPASLCISNVPGIPIPLYLAGARMRHFYPVSIPYHGVALNITVQSYAGQLEFGLTACRRALSQEESYELIGHLHEALREIEAFDGIGESVPAQPPALPAAGTSAPAKAAPARRKSAAKPLRQARRAPLAPARTQAARVASAAKARAS